MAELDYAKLCILVGTENFQDEYHYSGSRGGATDIKMVRQNRGAAGAEASAESTRMEAP